MATKSANERRYDTNAQRRTPEEPLHSANAECGVGGGLGVQASAGRAKQGWSGRWACYAAGAWALAFAAMSCYWAAGGMAGLETQSHVIKELASAPERDPRFVAVLWATGGAKLIGALVPLALARPWGRSLPRRLLRAVAWAAGLGMAVYGGVPLIVNGLMLAGAIVVPEPVDWTAIRWHFILWDPWWLLGGLLFIAAAWSSGWSSRPNT